MGNRRGFRKLICCFTKGQGPSTTFLPMRRMLAMSSSRGKWLRTCQSSVGRKSSNAISPAAHSQGLANSRRRGVSRMAISAASPKTSMAYLLR